MPRFPHFLNTATEIQNSDFRFHSLVAEAILCQGEESLGIQISATTARNGGTGSAPAPSNGPTNETK